MSVDTASIPIVEDKSKAPVVETPKTPDIPDKFKKADGSLDTDKLLGSYRELEGKQGVPPKVDTPVVPVVVVPDPKAITETDMTKLSKEFAENGKLSDDTYKSLAGKGFSKETVDTHIAGQQALADKYVNALHTAVGGKDSFDAMSDWAAQNLGKQELDSVNAVIKNGNAELSKVMLEGIQARYNKAMGIDPSFVSGGESVQSSGVKPFGSSREITTAMGDKRYRNDPAYRKAVEARLAVTTQLSI